MRIRAEDAAILLYAAMRGAKHPNVGHTDAFQTLARYREALSFSTEVPKNILEGCLYGIQLMDEAGEWWHPHFSAEEFCTQLGLIYDPVHGTVDKEDKRKK